MYTRQSCFALGNDHQNVMIIYTALSIWAVKILPTIIDNETCALHEGHTVQLDLCHIEIFANLDPRQCHAKTILLFLRHYQGI